MTQELKEAEQGTLVVVEAVLDVVGRFNDGNGCAGWTCPGCSGKLYGLNAYHQDASELLTQLRALEGKDLGAPCSLGRPRRVSGRLSALRIRMTISYSPHLP